MSDKQTFTREEFLNDVRGANGTRAQWFHLMLNEAKKHGIDPDEFCERTIYAFGLERGRKYGVCKGNPGKMARMLYSSNGQDVFEMELAEETDERGVLKFHFCPLAHTWKSMGLPAEEVSELCRLACYSDHARADCAGVDLEFPYQIGQGDDHCELVFTARQRVRAKPLASRPPASTPAAPSVLPPRVRLSSHGRDPLPGRPGARGARPSCA